MNDNFNEFNQLNQMNEQMNRQMTSEQEHIMRQQHDEVNRRREIMSDSGMYGEIDWEKARQPKRMKGIWILPLMLSMAIVLLILGIVIF